MDQKDIIFALSTPSGKSALAVFRISGKGCHKVVKKISSTKKIQKNKTTLNYIFDKTKKPIDQTLTTFFKSPKSFTGEDMVEISCHGSLAVLKKISKNFIENNMRPASPGEFTRRSLENNKIDIAKVEALGDLINANTEKQREMAFQNLKGGLTNYSTELKNKLLKIIANVEAYIDFSDEELPKNLKKKILEQKENIIKSIEETIKRSSLAEIIRQGFVVSVLGKPNTGKSSFVNYVSGRNVSIVTNVPGTTRDLVESLVEKNGYQIRFIDTAGIRKYRNKIEKIGIKKTIELSKKSDLNIVFLKKNETNQYDKTKNKIFVRSKHDIKKGKKTEKNILDISSVTGFGVEKLLNKVIKRLQPKNNTEIPIISRERQLLKLKNCLKHLKSFNLDKNIDMAADDLRFSLKEVEEVYHKFDIENILDIIFNDFCIGKWFHVKKNNKYDVVVVGGGHAGVEAACASARMGSKTALITHKIDKVGEMSCNPAIGGLGKGHLVREIDALDGIMGRAIDLSGIQFRMLNTSRGAAVRGPRAQADRKLYKKNIANFVEKQENLDLLEGSVEDIILKKNKVTGVLLSKGLKIFCESLVLTTGTFLRGMIRVGSTKKEAGRVGDNPSIKLAQTIERLKFSIGRLKTGTPPRILKKSINFNDLEEQYADKVPTPFSFINRHIHIPQVSCFITHTNNKTHQIIKKNLNLSPMYSGEIKSMGARYCPSIEDKVYKFPKKTSHQIFLEPEGLDSEVIYPNGISSSLPTNIQEMFVRTIKGLEKAIITQPAYAIEYDFVNPQELTHSLETKKIKNLFFAGQINGTTGYEEAAAQGIVAGLNASLKTNTSKKFIIDRSQGYIGVLIDDLVTKGTKEPYRMFTSRSEYRLILRADNADQRLTPLGIKIGCVSGERKKFFEEKLIKIKEGKNYWFSLKRI